MEEYKPSIEEIKKAKDMMTDMESFLSDRREEKIFRTETKEAIKPEILVVEDSFLDEAISILDKKVKGNYSLDLQGAMDYLDKNNPKMILTDMCFRERQTEKTFESTASKDYYDEFIKEILKEGPLKTTVDEYTKILKERKEQVLKYKINEKVQTPEDLFKYSVESNLHDGLPLGILIAEAAEKRKIPYIIVTSMNHGEAILPILSARKIIDRDELEYMTEEAKLLGHALSKNKKVLICRDRKDFYIWNFAYNTVSEKL